MAGEVSYLKVIVVDKTDGKKEKKKVYGVSAIIQGIGISKAPNQCDNRKNKRKQIQERVQRQYR